jgi:hypothetical protein
MAAAVEIGTRQYRVTKFRDIYTVAIHVWANNRNGTPAWLPCDPNGTSFYDRKQAASYAKEHNGYLANIDAAAKVTDEVQQQEQVQHESAAEPEAAATPKSKPIPAGAVIRILDDAEDRLYKCRLSAGGSVAKRVRAAARQIAWDKGADFVTEDDVFTAWRSIDPNLGSTVAVTSTTTADTAQSGKESTVSTTVEAVESNEVAVEAVDDEAVSIDIVDAAVKGFNPTETLILNALNESTDPLTKTQIGRLSPALKKLTGAATKGAYERLLANGVIKQVADGFVLVRDESSTETPVVESAVITSDVTGDAEQLREIANRVIETNPTEAVDDELKAEINGLNNRQRASIRAMVIEHFGKGTGEAGGRFRATGLQTADEVKAARAAGAVKRAETVKVKEEKAKEVAANAKQYIRFTPSYKAASDSICCATAMAIYSTDAKKKHVEASDIEAAVVAARPEDGKKYLREALGLLVKRAVIETVADKDGKTVGYKMPADVRKMIKGQVDAS